MYQNETDAKVDELTSLVKAVDTKIKFLMDDMDEVKAAMAGLEKALVEIVTMLEQTTGRSSGETHKAARLDAFREQTSRW